MVQSVRHITRLLFAFLLLVILHTTASTQFLPFAMFHGGDVYTISYDDTVRYTITPTTGPNGTIVPSIAQGVASGGSLSFSFVPDAGFQIDTVFVDDVKVDSTDGYTFTNIITDHTIRLVFKSLPVASYDSLANLIYWGEASKVQGKSNGDTLGTWADNSGGGNDITQTIAAYKPKYMTNIFGSQPGIQFGAAEADTAYYNSTAFVNTVSGTDKAWTVIMVQKQIAVYYNAYFWELYHNTGNGWVFARVNPTGPAIELGALTDASTWSPECAWTAVASDSIYTRTNVYTFMKSSDSLFSYFNGTLKASAEWTSGAITLQVSTIGSGDTGERAFIGKMALLLVYARRLTASDLNWIWTKIRNDYGTP